MIEWGSFLLVAVASLTAACVLVTLFSLALRVGDGPGRARRAGSVGLYVLCGLAVLGGIYLIVPALHALG